jgi:L-threonylcarbamoyladenylate synthase
MINDSIYAEINKSLDVLKNGGIILYPTDTIWGIGCDATNDKAVERIFNLKQREDSKSMIILLDNAARLSSYIRDVPEQAWDLIELSTNPLTVILPGARNLAKNLITQDDTVGIRITNDAFCNALIQRFKKPIVSTSANISGQPSPENFSQISDEIKAGVDYVVSLRQSEKTKGRASTIIQLGLGGEIKIIRK